MISFTQISKSNPAFEPSKITKSKPLIGGIIQSIFREIFLIFSQLIQILANKFSIIQAPRSQEVEKVHQKAEHILNCKNIYWLPHPKFTKDQGSFPFKDPNPLQVYGLKHFVHLFQEEKKRKQALLQGYNVFLLWLNEQSEEQKSEKMTFADYLCEGKDQIFFMNCNDFVFFTLYSSGLISKKHIQKIYENERHRQFNNESNTNWFGISLNQLETFTSNMFNSHPGAIVVCLDQDDNPIHMMIEGKNNEAFTLWCYSDYRVAKMNLKDVPSFYAKESGGKKIKMKRCSLNLFLEQIQETATEANLVSK